MPKMLGAAWPARWRLERDSTRHRRTSRARDRVALARELAPDPEYPLDGWQGATGRNWAVAGYVADILWPWEEA